MKLLAATGWLLAVVYYSFWSTESVRKETARKNAYMAGCFLAMSTTFEEAHKVKLDDIALGYISNTCRRVYEDYRRGL